MKLRFLMLAVGLSFAVSPALAATGTTLDPLGAFSKAPVVKKDEDLKKKPVKKAAKKPVKKKVVAKKKPEPVVEEKPKGLFASLFGTSEAKGKTDKKATASKSSKDKLAKDKAAKDKLAKDAKSKKDESKPALSAKARKDEDGKKVAAAGDNAFAFGLFGGSKSVGPSNLETIALDDAQKAKDAKSKFRVKKEFEPTIVAFPGGYKPGTIVVKTDERRLYLVEPGGKARRYAIAVGKEGLQFTGKGTVGDMQEWPRWIPTKEMIEREPKKYKQYEDGMDGGPDNPLGARAIYLYQGKQDTHIRVHGTIAPNSIGTAASNGCFRMINSHVVDLYGRVKMGSEFIVL